MMSTGLPVLGSPGAARPSIPPLVEVGLLDSYKDASVKGLRVSSRWCLGYLQRHFEAVCGCIGWYLNRL